MERTITYDGERWRVWVDAAPDRDRPKSGLELVFSAPGGSEIRRPVGPALLRALSKEALDLDEMLLREALASALERESAGDAGERRGRTDVGT